MRISINKSLYSKAAVFKTAYHFTDECYIYIDADDCNYFVDLTEKENCGDKLKERFCNELLAQATRESIFEQTHNIRELILGRAFASTMIEKDDTESSGDSEVDCGDDDVFSDWYGDKNET